MRNMGYIATLLGAQTSGGRRLAEQLQCFSSSDRHRQRHRPRPPWDLLSSARLYFRLACIMFFSSSLRPSSLRASLRVASSSSSRAASSSSSAAGPAPSGPRARTSGGPRRPQSPRRPQPGRPRPLVHPQLGLRPDNWLNVQVGPRPNAGLVPLDMREELYRLHKSDPNGKGDLNRISALTGLPIPKIQGIIKLRQFEKDYERDVLGGAPLDQTQDQEFRNLFGEKRSWKDDDAAASGKGADMGIEYEFYREGEVPPENSVAQNAQGSAKPEPWRVVDHEEILGKEVKKTNKFRFRKVESKPAHLRGSRSLKKKGPIRAPAIH